MVYLKVKSNFRENFFLFYFGMNVKKCHKLFKWEWMWGKWCYIYSLAEGGDFMRICVCQHCAQTKQQSQSILRHWR
jgi:hypothetical protein